MEQQSPAENASSPQASTEVASLQDNRERNRESLEWGLKTRRPVEELIDQGIMTNPLLSNADKVRRLQRAKTSDTLKHKIGKRPDKQFLLDQHILKVDPVTLPPHLLEKREMLEKNHIKDCLNAKLEHRPGSLELVEKGVLVVDPRVQSLIRGGSISYPRVDTSCSFSISEEVGSSGNMLSRQHAIDDDWRLSYEDSMDVFLPPCETVLTPATLLEQQNQHQQQQQQQQQHQQQLFPTITMTQPNFVSTQAELISSAIQLPTQTSCGYSFASNSAVCSLATVPQESFPSADNRLPAGGKASKNKKEQISKFGGLVFHNYVPTPQQRTQAARELQQQEFLRLQDTTTLRNDLMTQLTEEIRQRDAETPVVITTAQRQFTSQPIPPPPPPPPPIPAFTYQPRVVPLKLQRPGKEPEALEHLTLNQLKQECRLRSLPRSGKKSTLIRALEPYRSDILRKFSGSAAAGTGSPTRVPSPQVANDFEHLLNGDSLKHSSSAPNFDTSGGITQQQRDHLNNSLNSSQVSFGLSNSANLVLMDGQNIGVSPMPATSFVGSLSPQHQSSNGFVSMLITSQTPTSTVTTTGVSHVASSNGQPGYTEISTQFILNAESNIKHLKTSIIRNLQMSKQYRRKKGDLCEEVITLAKERQSLMTSYTQFTQHAKLVAKARLESLGEALVHRLTLKQANDGTTGTLDSRHGGEDLSLDPEEEARLEEIGRLQDFLKKLEASPGSGSSQLDGTRGRSRTDTPNSSMSMSSEPGSPFNGLNGSHRSWSDSLPSSDAPGPPSYEAHWVPQPGQFVRPTTPKLVHHQQQQVLNSQDDEYLLQLINDIIEENGSTGDRDRQPDSDSLFSLAPPTGSSGTVPVAQHGVEFDFNGGIPMSPMQVDTDQFDASVSPLPQHTSQSFQGSGFNGQRQQVNSLQTANYQPYPGMGGILTASPQRQKQRQFNKAAGQPGPSDLDASNFPFNFLDEYSSNMSSNGDHLSVNFSSTEQILTPGTESVLYQTLQQNSMDTTDINDVFQ